MEAKRQRISDLLHTGMTRVRIVDIVGCSESLVYKVQRMVRDGESLERKPGQGRPKKDIGEAVAAAVKADPTKPMLAMARELNVAFRTVKDKVKDLSLKSYVCQHCQLHSEALKKSRLDRGKKLITWLKHHPSTVRIFSNKKMWTVDQARNAQNNQFLARSPSEVPPIN